MEWTPLPTNYIDSVWTGKKRYQRIDNSDGSISFRDMTEYYIEEDSFLGANEINRINAAINTMMDESRGIKPCLSIAVESGAFITVTGGTFSASVTAIDDRTCLDIPAYGTYIVSAVKNGNTSSIETVVVDTVRIYTVVLTF